MLKDSIKIIQYYCNNNSFHIHYDTKHEIPQVGLVKVCIKRKIRHKLKNASLKFDLASAGQASH